MAQALWRWSGSPLEGERLGALRAGGSCLFRCLSPARTLVLSSAGIVACEQAIEDIGLVISDLDMALVFSAAGQLDPVDKSDSFNSYKQTILDGSRDLTNDAKGLVAGATSTQEHLAAAAASSVRSIGEVASAMKAAATTMTSADRNGQNQLLASARMVAVKLQEHVEASMKGTRACVRSGAGRGGGARVGRCEAR